MQLAANAVSVEFRPLDVANSLWAPARLEVQEEKLIEPLVGKARQIKQPFRVLEARHTEQFALPRAVA